MITRHCATSWNSPNLQDDDGFFHNRQQAETGLESLEKQQADLQNQQVEHRVEFQKLRSQHDELEAEIASLKSRQSNIPSRNLAIRQALVNLSTCRNPPCPLPVNCSRSVKKTNIGKGRLNEFSIISP